MEDKKTLHRKICELDFAIHELVLYLDNNPNCEKALALLEKFRTLRKAAVEEYEQHFGKLIVTPKDAGKGNYWNWIDSPWPWEKDFMEDL